MDITATRKSPLATGNMAPITKPSPHCPCAFPALLALGAAWNKREWFWNLTGQIVQDIASCGEFLAFHSKQICPEDGAEMGPVLAFQYFSKERLAFAYL